MQDGNRLLVRRISDGDTTKVAADTGESTFRGPEAEGHLINLIWKEAAAAVDPTEALASVLTRSIYLQQDTLRNFIESITEQDRFAAISELVGAGRVVELQSALEREKAAWTKATNARDSELQTTRDRLYAMEKRLADYTSRSGKEHTDVEVWNRWWADLIECGGTSIPAPIGTQAASDSIHEALMELEGIFRKRERRLQRARVLFADLKEAVSIPPAKTDDLQRRSAELKAGIERLTAELQVEQERMSEARRTQAQLREKTDQLRTLATIALQHLGTKCPVCMQSYDIEATRKRLEEFVAASPFRSERRPDFYVLGILSRLTSAEQELSVIEREQRKIARLSEERKEKQESLRRRLEELEIHAETLAEALDLVENETRTENSALARIAEVRRSGEQLSLGLAQAVDQAVIIELQREIDAARRRLEAEDARIAHRNNTGDEAQRVIEALREAALGVVTQSVRGIEPLLSEIYSRIGVHPTFQIVRFLTSVVRGKGQLSAIVEDPVARVEQAPPATVLSSSQINALAVCVFLSLNLGVPDLPLRTIVLDDPLQSLDDIHLLGLVELLRRVKDERQLCVSTHDSRFGSLLARKLRPRSSDQRTVLIELEGWGRSGPTVHCSDIEADPVPLRLLAS